MTFARPCVCELKGVEVSELNSANGRYELTSKNIKLFDRFPLQLLVAFAKPAPVSRNRVVAVSESKISSRDTNLRPKIIKLRKRSARQRRVTFARPCALQGGRSVAVLKSKISGGRYEITSKKIQKYLLDALSNWASR